MRQRMGIKELSQRRSIVRNANHFSRTAEYALSVGMVSIRGRVSFGLHLACLLLLGVAVIAPTLAKGMSLPATFPDWLARVRALVCKQLIECFFLKGPHTALLSENMAWRWSGSVWSSKDWKNYHSANVKGVEFTAKHGGVIISSFNAHVHGDGTFHARFAVDNVAAFHGYWGAYYVRSTTAYWAPFSFVQMFAVPCQRSSNKINVRLQTQSPSWEVNGAGLVAALLPPPSFLTSLQSSAISGKSSQAPFENLVHNVNVSSRKALLVMAANGRAKGNSNSTSMTYTVDGYSPTRQHGKDYGFYHLTKELSQNLFFHMGLYQLAEVSSGSHKIQLEGRGSAFDLQYATSQVAVVPVDSIQLKTKTADWTLIVRKLVSKSLLHAYIVAPQDSLLVMAANFEVSSKCSRYAIYVQFTIDKKIQHSSRMHKKVGLAGFNVNFNSNVSYPGSLMKFAKVKKGIHRIGLLASHAYLCDVLVHRAAMQVGVIPQSF